MRAVKTRLSQQEAETLAEYLQSKCDDSWSYKAVLQGEVWVIEIRDRDNELLGIL